MDEDERLRWVLFNDISRAPYKKYILLSDREEIANHLYRQGWRREVRSEDYTPQGGNG